MKKPEPPKPMSMMAHLVGDLRMPIGKITLTEDKTVEDFANAAYKQASGSLKRLMQPKWKIEITDKHGQSHSFGLEKWNKLVDASEAEKRRIEAFQRAREKSASLYGFRP